MSIESHLASENKKKKPQFKDVMGRLLAEKDPVNTRPWKWEDEVGEADIKLMVEEAEAYKKDGHWQLFFEVAYAIKLFDPRYTPKLDEYEWSMVEGQLVSCFKKDATDSYGFWLAASAHFFDPNRNLHLKILGVNFLDEMEEELKMRIVNKEWLSVIDTATHICILYPDRRLHLMNTFFTDEIWSNINKELEKHRRNSGRLEDGWKGLASTAKSIRMLKQQNELALDDSVWQGMENELESMRRKPPDRFSLINFGQLAFYMRILAAHKVEITKNGITIIDDAPEKLDSGLPPRPTRKRKL